MGRILCAGMTEYPYVRYKPDELMNSTWQNALRQSSRCSLEDRSTWPEPMRAEYGEDDGAAAARTHREELIEGFRTIRRALDDFEPEVVMVVSEDHLENFRRTIPKFAVYGAAEYVIAPYWSHSRFLPTPNVWDEPPEHTFTLHGAPRVALHVVNSLNDSGFDVGWVSDLTESRFLPHSFAGVFTYLDWDRRGLDYPVVPLHVDLYGGTAGISPGALDGLDFDNAARVQPVRMERAFDFGAELARILLATDLRVALIASSSWSHAFLNEAGDYLMPNLEADRSLYELLEAGQLRHWREVPDASLLAAGQLEVLTWTPVVAAAHVAGVALRSLNMVQTALFNSTKVFAVWS
jgi:hypothetical protein